MVQDMHVGSGVQMPTQPDTQHPETPAGRTSEAARVAIQGYIFDIVIECSAEDANHPDLKGIQLVIMGSNDNKNNRGSLKSTAQSTWEYSGIVEVCPEMSELIFVVQSEDGDDIGYLALTKEEIEEYAGEMLLNDMRGVEHKFIMEARVPALTLQFAISGVKPDLKALVCRLLVKDLASAFYLFEVMQCCCPGVDILAQISYCLGCPPEELLTKFGGILTIRFERTGSISDISKAIEYQQRAIALTPDGHANMPLLLSDLGTSFFYLCEQTSNPDDLSKAIEYLHRAVALTPEDHTVMPSMLNNLGNSFIHRFQQTGNLDDISKAITYLHHIVALIPEGHATMPSCLNNLGISFHQRFHRTYNLDDMLKAIEYTHRAVALTSEDDVDMPSRLSNLGLTFGCRFEETGNLDDILKEIECLRRAVALTPEGHIEMPLLLGNLGNSLHQRFEKTGNIDDISKAIEHQHHAVALTPNGHVSMPLRLAGLGNTLRTRFAQMGNLDDISTAIELQNHAISLTPEGHASMPWQRVFIGQSLMARLYHTGDMTDCKAAALNFHRAATQLYGHPSARLGAAMDWARLSIMLGDQAQSLHAYTVAVEMLSLVAGLDQTIQNRHDNLVTCSNFTPEAVVAAIAAEHTSTALEWLEQGRCLVWAQLNQLRTPVDYLREHDAPLAEQFLTVSKALELSGSRPAEPSAGEMALTHHIKVEDQARTHLKLALEWEQLLVRIRHIPKFHNFLQPNKAATILSQLPPEGPIIIISVYAKRCDALALIHGADEVLHIPLKDITYKKLEKLRRELRDYLALNELLMRNDRAGRPKPRRSATNIDSLRNILHILWKCVIKPILDGLGYCSTSAPRTRIWWCPTGPLAFLPIHAAGIYGSDEAIPGSCLSDYALSSYIPTVNTLLEKLGRTAKSSQSNTTILLVSQPNTPGLPLIPGTTAETQTILDRVAANGVGALRLERKEATTRRVAEELESHPWVHFACHASQHPTAPLKSGICLYDGRLELMDLIRHELPTAEFAFLSACQTSVGDEKLSDEAIHLAAGMLAAGYQGVVGTMWSIKDWYAPKIAEEFYGHLLQERMDSGSRRLDSSRAVYALDHAIQKIRSELPIDEHSLLTWVPYAHYGL